MGIRLHFRAHAGPKQLDARLQCLVPGLIRSPDEGTMIDQQVETWRRRMSGAACALLAAALFGASTPLAKLLIDDLSPLLLAGLLYLGSGVGLMAFRLMRDHGWISSRLA